MYTNKNANPINYIFNITQFNASYLILDSTFAETNETIAMITKFNSFLKNLYVLVHLEYDGIAAVPKYKSINTT